jgi:hypothetical protein
MLIGKSETGISHNQLNPLLLFVCFLFVACEPKVAEQNKRSAAPLAAAGDEGTGDSTGDDDDDNDEEPAVFTTDETYWDFAKSTIDTHCVPCHSDSPLNGAPATFRLDVYSSDLKDAIKEKLDRIVIRLTDNSMPPEDSEPIPSSDYSRLLSWAQAGGPEGTKPLPPPSVEISDPDEAGEPLASNQFDVTLSFANLGSESLTWSLFYTTTSGAKTGGTAFVSDQATTVTKATFDATTLANGIYYFYAILKDDSGTEYSAVSEGSVTVNNPQAPVVALSGFAKTGTPIGNLDSGFETTANAANMIDISSNTVSISFTVSDPQSDPTTVDIELSTDGGTSFTNIANDYAGASPFVWDAAANGIIQQTDVRFKIIASDGTNTAEDVSTANIYAYGQLYDYDGGGDDITSLLATNCSACHNNGSFVRDAWDNGSGIDVESKRSQIWRRTVDLNPSVMPPGGQLGQTLLDKIIIWRALGFPE